MPTILVIHSKGPARNHLTRILRDVGFDVVSAADDAEALACLSTGIPDGIMVSEEVVLAYDMELCRYLREVLDLPLVVVGDYSDQMTAAMMLENGADAYLRKPINATLLSARLRSLFRRYGLRRHGGISGNGNGGFPPDRGGRRSTETRRNPE